MNQEASELTYVLVAGEIRHVSEFSHLPPAERPPALCPACDEGVIMHLGQVYAHHYQHRPGSACALTNPETALHYNSKIYIYNELRKGGALSVPWPCSGWTAPRVGRFHERRMPCMSHTGRTVERFFEWTSVEVEKYVGTHKPDIVLYRDGLPVGAVEVFATHAVDERKAEALQALGVPWAEVRASDIHFSASSLRAWKLSKPLPTYRVRPHLPR